MYDTYILHDQRLSGHLSNTATRHVGEVRDTFPLDRIIDQVAIRIAENEVVNLVIAAHGLYGAGFSDAPATPGGDTSHSFGGFGIQLGRDNIINANVHLFTRLRNSSECTTLRNIVIYACGAADIMPGGRNGVRDGFLLCREMAAHSGCSVYASDTAQRFSTWRVNPTRTGMVQSDIYFSEWEGTVYKFDPDGSSTVVRDTSGPISLLY